MDKSSENNEDILLTSMQSLAYLKTIAHLLVEIHGLPETKVNQLYAHYLAEIKEGDKK